MKNLSKRDSIILVGIIVLVILFGYYKLLLSPLISDISDTRSEVSGMESEINLEKTRVNMNATYKKQLATEKAKYTQELPAIPEYINDPQIAYDLKKTADNNGVTFQNFSFSSPKNYSADQNSKNSTINTNTSKKTGINLEVLPETISITGSDYVPIYNFINSLETQPRLTNIDTFTITGNANSITASITANSYFVASQTPSDSLKYDFLKGDYGKNDLFK